MTEPLWLAEAAAEHGCDRCAVTIREGEPLAWLPGHGDGELLCFDCASAAEDAAA